jgi:acetylornithine deacetylase/succinyl-diaminopimelate desuccinylase-like protein
VLRQLLTRLEDESTGAMRLPELHADVPPDRLAEVRKMAEALGDEVWTQFPFAPGVQPMGGDNIERILGRTWRSTLSVTGAAGMPQLESAGNVLRPHTALALSIRLPPTTNADIALAAVTRELTRDPPSGAQIALEADAQGGWNAPSVAPWLGTALEQASQQNFGRAFMCMGEGGSIPFMGMLGAAFPEAQFMITGVLGPGSNAHGPNEFLHIEFARKLTVCVSQVLAAHAQRHGA